MSQLLNKQVEHSTYGTGTVVTHSTDRITVSFAGEAGEKGFVYPDAFGQYLTSTDPAVQQRIEDELRVRAEQAEADKLRREQERQAEIARLAEAQLAAKSSKRKSSRRTTKAQ
ncbi:hypothetical protein D3C75_244010 [compost metagenome]